MAEEKYLAENKLHMKILMIFLERRCILRTKKNTIDLK